MNLSAAQFLQLTRTREQAFLERAGRFLEKVTHRLPEHGVLAILYERGLRHGLTSEQQLVGYLLFAWAANAPGSPVDIPWIAECMNDPHLTPTGKVEALFAYAAEIQQR